MKKLAFSSLLIGLGIVIIVMGHRRENSIAGVSDSVGTSLANTWDGKARQPEYLWYYVGGGTLILAGIVTALRKKTS